MVMPQIGKSTGVPPVISKVRGQDARAPFSLVFAVAAEIVEARTFGTQFALKETVQLADTGRVAHLAERLGFDLANTFAGHFELPSHFLQSPAVAVLQAEAQGKNAPLAVGE